MGTGRREGGGRDGFTCTAGSAGCCSCSMAAVNTSLATSRQAFWGGAGGETRSTGGRRVASTHYRGCPPKQLVVLVGPGSGQLPAVVPPREAHHTCTRGAPGLNQEVGRLLEAAGQGQGEDYDLVQAAREHRPRASALPHPRRNSCRPGPGRPAAPRRARAAPWPPMCVFCGTFSADWGREKRAVSGRKEGGDGNSNSIF